MTDVTQILNAIEHGDLKAADDLLPIVYGELRKLAAAMRRILIERARKRSSLKRGGGREKIDLEHVEPAILPMACDDLLGLDEALQKLEQQHPRKARLVKLRFFTGLTVPQAAHMLEISTSTAENDWAYARSWLRLEMSGKDAD